MRGIVGIIRKSSYEGIEDDLRQMVEAMRHAKFYRDGAYVNKDVGLYAGWAHHENTFSDCMPLVSEDGATVLIFQGEHYPCGPDRGKNDAHKATSILKLYENSGERFLSRLNGWFCGLLVDLRTRKVTLFNDRYGMG